MNTVIYGIGGYSKRATNGVCFEEISVPVTSVAIGIKTID